MKIEEDKYPDLEDLKIDRDEDGEIVPIKGETPDFDRPIIVKPMPMGANEKYFGDVLHATNADARTKAQVLDQFYVRPDFSGITEEDVKENLDRQTVNDYLNGLMAYSGAFRQDGELVDDNPNE